MKFGAKLVLGVLGWGLIAFAISWLIFMPNSQERGIWRLSSGGAILKLTPITATLYTESSHSCFRELTFPAHLKLVELSEGATIEIVEGQLNLYVDGSLETQAFDRIAALPSQCKEATSEDVSARDVFEAVWTAMDEHYAFFDLHGVNWDERRSFIPSVTEQWTDDQIRNGLLEMLDGIDDGHVHFGSNEHGFLSPSERPAWIPVDGSLTRERLTKIAKANAGTALLKSDQAEVFYGLRPDRVGYIMIVEMDVDVPFGGRSTQTMARVFDDILDELDEAKALLIDIRYNPGGSDTVSFGIAGHFVDEPLRVFSKTTRAGDQQVSPFTAVLQPNGPTAERRPTAVMTSKLTGSAAEIFTLVMREIPNVIIIGEPTSGGLSDVMGFVLPNGWALGLSNQTYLTNANELFERTGIPPDVQVSYDAEAFLSGQDPSHSWWLMPVTYL